jgi:2-dehydro-3-deoxygalactonokinase
MVDPKQSARRMTGIEATWIAADWGTSHLRVWAMSTAGDVLASAESDRGMGTLTPDQYEAALLALVADWLAPDATTLIFACGMAGARQGWIEAPYLVAPCAPHATDEFVRAPTTDPRLDVRIAPGIQQTTPPDVMRGEETQIAGFLKLRPDFIGTVCLPGTHTKWARLSSGRIEGFQTFMTGELFALLSQQSVLRHSVGPGCDERAFAQAVRQALAQPEALTARLFSLRAGSLLAGLTPDAARAALSGLLIGTEIAALGLPRETGQIALIGANCLAETYATALRTLGREVEIVDAECATLQGLKAAKAALSRLTSETGAAP